MSKVRDISNLSNVIRTDASGNVSFVSGSTTLATINTSGQLSGSSPVLSSSYALNADLLDGLDSTQFTLTSSFAAQTASFTAFTSSINSFSASILSYTASQNITNGTFTTTSSFNAQTASFTAFTASVNSFTASQLVLNGKYATTGSNTFTGIQTINSNLVVTGSITAQTLVVQTITSSVDFVTGSTRFGSILANTHVFSGSVTMNPGGLFVSSSGNVGIGNTNPSFALTIQADNTDMISWRSPSYEVGRLGLDSTNAHGAIFLYSSGSRAIQISAKPGAYTYFNAGNVGIGTSSPAYTLDVTGTGRFTGALTGTSATFSGNVVLGTTALSGGGAAQWLTANGTAYGGGLISSVSGVIKAYYYYDNSGYAFVQGASGVGVNLVVNGSTNALTIASTGAATFSSSVTTGGDVTIPNGNYYYAKRSTGDASINVLGIAAGSDTLTIKGGTSGATTSIKFSDTGGDIAGFYNGRFGLGTISPTNTFEIIKDQAATTTLYIQNTNDQANAATEIRLYGNEGVAPLKNAQQISFVRGSGGVDWALGQPANSSDFVISGGTDQGDGKPSLGTAERIRITSGGNVGIGITPTEKLHIYSSAGPELRMESSAVSWYIRAYNDNFNVLTPTGRQAVSFLNNGDVRNYNNTTTWQQSSDVRVKENINTISDAIGKILSLNPVIFDYKQEFADINKWDDNKKINNVGFIAQEFESIFPKYISTNKYEMTETIIDDFKSIDTGHLVAYLVKGMQEQQAQINELKAQING